MSEALVKAVLEGDLQDVVKVLDAGISINAASAQETDIHGFKCYVCATVTCS